MSEMRRSRRTVKAMREGMAPPVQVEKVSDLGLYNAAKETTKSLRDDFLIGLAWYAQWKSQGDRNLLSRDQIKMVLKKVVAELASRGDTLFHPDKLAPDPREIFDEIASELKLSPALLAVEKAAPAPEAEAPAGSMAKLDTEFLLQLSDDELKGLANEIAETWGAAFGSALEKATEELKLTREDVVTAAMVVLREAAKRGVDVGFPTDLMTEIAKLEQPTPAATTKDTIGTAALATAGKKPPAHSKKKSPLITKDAGESTDADTGETSSQLVVQRHFSGILTPVEKQQLQRGLRQAIALAKSNEDEAKVLISDLWKTFRLERMRAPLEEIAKAVQQTSAEHGDVSNTMKNFLDAEPPSPLDLHKILQNLVIRGNVYTDLKMQSSADERSTSWTIDTPGIALQRLDNTVEILPHSKLVETQVNGVLAESLNADPHEHFFPILKSAEEERTVFGVVLEPETVDAHGDVISAEEIRNAAYQYLEFFQLKGFQHGKSPRYPAFPEGVRLLESYVLDPTFFPNGFMIGSRHIKPGTWLIRMRVDHDGLWEDIKTGRITGFSIGGFARAMAADQVRN